MVELNDDAPGTYDINSPIKCKTTILKSALCDYSDAHILAKETITVANTANIYMLVQIIQMKQ